MTAVPIPANASEDEARRFWLSVHRAERDFLTSSLLSRALLNVLLVVDEEYTGLREGTTGIARHLGIRPSACGELVRKLEELELLQRQPVYALRSKKGSMMNAKWEEIDPGVKSVLLTEKGRALLASFFSTMGKAHRAAAALVVKKEKKHGRA